MNTYFINLAEDTARCKYLERNFRDFAPDNWRLIRVPAIDAAMVQEQGLGGRLRATEIACLKSHRAAILASLSDTDHSLIVEDDALFGPRTFERLTALDVLQNPACDLVFLSANFGDLGSVVQQIFWCRSLVGEGRTTLVDMSSITFAGADSYIVKNEAKQKLLDMLDSLTTFDVPYDLLLRQLVHRKLLNAALVYPYLTSLSPLAEQSRNGNGNPIWHTFNALRRLQWFDAKDYPGNILEGVERIESDFYDSEAEQYAKVLKVMLSRKFVFA